MILSGHSLSRLFVLDFGTFDVGPGKRLIGIPGFLLETDRGARLLIDCGFDPLYATDPAAAEARDNLSAFGRLVNHSALQTLHGQLALLGLSPADVTGLILTHGHIDHVGALAQLSHCPIWLTAAERAEPRPIYWGDVRPIDWPDTTYHQIERPTEIAQGITLIPTPGHTPGHLSLHLVLPAGEEVIIAADAINRASEPGEGFPDAMDPTIAARSAKALLSLSKTLGATLIYGHDPAQWQILPKAPLPFV